MRDRYYAQINLAPLLDIVFTTLFLFILSVNQTYKDATRVEAQTHQQTVQGVQADLQQAQASAEKLSDRLASVEQQNARIAAALAAQQQSLVDGQSALVASEEARNATQARLDQITQELTRTQGIAQDQQRTIQVQTTQLELARAAFQALQNQRNVLDQQKAALATELAQKKQALAVAQQAFITQTYALSLTTTSLTRTQAEARTAAQRIQAQTVALEQTRQQAKSLESRIAALTQQQSALAAAVAQRDQALTAVRNTLANKENELNTVKTELARTTQALTDAKAALGGEISTLQQQIAQDKATITQLNRAVEKLTATVKQSTAEKSVLDAKVVDTQTQLANLQAAAAQTEQVRLQYQAQIDLMQEKLADPVEAALKADFVDKYIDVYTLNISAAGQGASTLALIGKNNIQANAIIINEEQVKTFLHQQLNRFDKDKTFIIFMRTQNSLYQHEKWVENYLETNDFIVGYGRQG